MELNSSRKALDRNVIDICEVLSGLIGFYKFLLAFTGFFFTGPLKWVCQISDGFYRVLFEFNGFLPGFTGFYLVFNGINQYLMGSTGFYWFFTGLNQILMGFSRFYWVLLGFTGSY